MAFGRITQALIAAGWVVRSNAKLEGATPFVQSPRLFSPPMLIFLRDRFPALYQLAQILFQAAKRLGAFWLGTSRLGASGRPWRLAAGGSLAIALVLLLACPAPAIAYNYSRAIMDGQDFPNDDFSGSNFSMAKLRRSDLSGTNFERANLFGARLDDSNLTGANLRETTLDSALMKRTNLTNADLSGAYAMNTVFDNAIIDGADFTDVLLEPQVLKGLCELAQGTNPVTGRATRETLACDELGF